MGLPKFRSILPHLRICLPFCIILLALACSPSGPVKLGFLGGVTGRVADLGIAGRDGARLAVDLRNQAGGISGRKVLLLIRDDKHDMDIAKRQAQDLIDEDVSAIIGPMTSQMAMAITPVMNKAKVVAVAPTATTEALSGKDDYFFRITATTKVFATANANYQIKNKRMNRVAAAYDLGNRSYSEMWLNNFADAMAAGGGEVVSKVGFTSGKVESYSKIAKELLSAQADGIVIVANAVDASLLCQQIRKLDADMPITLSDWAAQERLIELGGKAVEGVTVGQTFDRENEAPRYLEFRKVYKERFGREPGFAGVDAFDAANLVMDALARRTGETTLKQAILASSPYNGLQGPIAMNAFGDVQSKKYSISVVKDAKFEVVE
jgi:branched-chain amino acid transport system substrate-binding protein